MCTVSIIIPTFNRYKVLQRALNSVLKQSYLEYEIIVIDDGSTDITAKIMAELFPQVRYIFQDNKGVSSARNKGLELAKGEWIAFLDSDDEWLPEKLTLQLGLLKSTPKYKICHTEELWIRNGTQVNQMNKHKKFGGWIFPQCLPLCAMSPSSIVIHKSIFEKVGCFDISLPACEDYDLWLRITAKYPVLYIEEPQIKKYGGHDDQLSKKHWGMDQFRIIALQRIVEDRSLKREYQAAAVAMLLKKSKIFQKGALKRGKTESVQHYQRIIDQYST